MAHFHGGGAAGRVALPTGSVARETQVQLKRETLDRLYQRHGYAVFRRCRGLLRDPEEARDAMQETFLKVLEDPGRFRGQSSPATFLFGVATHLCLNRLRHRRARGEVWRASLVRSLEGERPREGGAAEARQVVGMILAEADEETARMAIHHFVDGLSQGEIARLVGCSREKVNQELQRFRADARGWAGEP